MIRRASEWQVYRWMWGEGSPLYLQHKTMYVKHVFHKFELCLGFWKAEVKNTKVELWSFIFWFDKNQVTKKHCKNVTNQQTLNFSLRYYINLSTIFWHHFLKNLSQSTTWNRLYPPRPQQQWTNAECEKHRCDFLRQKITIFPIFFVHAILQKTDDNLNFACTSL